MNETGFVLGVDGGGTKTDYLLYDTTGSFRDSYRGGATNHECLEGGAAETELQLNEAIRLLLKRNGVSPGDIKGAMFGMAGVDVPKQRVMLEDMFKRMGFGNFIVTNDAYLGVKAGCQRGVGICAVNGTGNTVAGIDSVGRMQQVAGMGPISGDDGGAHSIASLALRAVYEAFFCLGKPTAMTEPILRLLRSDGPESYMEAVYDRFFTQEVTPRDVLEILFRCGNQGDEAAVGIQRRIGMQIARCIAGCAARMSFGPELDVTLVGSVMLKAACPVMLDTLKAETAALTQKTVRFHPLGVPPAAGAVYWALELALGHGAAEPLWDIVMKSSQEAIQ
jgi:N-acetylglucosamine kinase-like BadF-type ATPase